jgi:hypothetical protein
MDVSGQLYALAALQPGKNQQHTLNRRLCDSLRGVADAPEKEISIAAARNQNPSLFNI